MVRIIEFGYTIHTQDALHSIGTLFSYCTQYGIPNTAVHTSFMAVIALFRVEI